MTRAARWMFLIVTLGASGSAHATLGETESSLDTDRRSLQMERPPATARGDVTVHELSGPTSTVREFVARSGKIFAVAWEGIAPPDLAALLGAYYDELRDAGAGRRLHRGPRRVETARVVVETWGHARSLHGRAYLPALVPPGASLSDVR